jgi:hypothetical protein
VFLSTSTANPVGLELVKTQAVGSSVTSVTVSDAWSADYDVYEVLYTDGTMSNVSAQMQARVGGVSSGYKTNVIYSFYSTPTTVQGAGVSGTGFWFIGGNKQSTTNGPCYVAFRITNPFVAKYTFLSSQMYGAETTVGTANGVLDTTASYTSLTLLTDTGTFSGGNVKIYGYKK